MGVRLSVRSCWASRNDADAVYELDLTRIVIGRGRGADVRLPHRSVSVRHATIELSGARYTLVDHETTNGTSVQGTRVVPGREKPLRDGDRIEMGGFSIVFQSGIAVGEATSSERTASLARRLAREALEAREDRLDPIVTILNGAREGEVVNLPEPPSRLVLGRGDDVDITLPDEDASRAHAELEVDLDGVMLRDLESKNGTHVGEHPVEAHRLKDREEFRIGATLLRFEDPASAHVTELEGGDDASTTPPSWQDIQPPPLDPEQEEDATLVDADEPSPQLQPPAPPPVRRVAALDMVIYVLAAAVFAVSLLGLFWILRA
ncbi:MAG: FHA domain-containing protein [Sandaracinaceae bacterium]